MRNMQQIVVVTHNFAGIWQRGEEETNLIISYPGCPGPVIQHVLGQSVTMGYKLISGWTKHLLQQTDSHCILHLPSCSWLLLVTQLGASLHPPLYSDRHYTVVFYLDIDTVEKDPILRSLR